MTARVALPPRGEYTRAVSAMLAGAVLCFFVLLGLAGVGVFLVVRAERRHEASVAPRPKDGRADHATADLSFYLRLEGEGARSLDALAAAHAPRGDLAPEAVRPVAEAILGALDEATHGAVVVAGYKVDAVQTPEPGGVVVCLRIHSRAPVAVPARPTHRVELASLLREVAALDAEQLVSAQFQRARTTTARSAPALEVLLGPHRAPTNP